MATPTPGLLVGSTLAASIRFHSSWTTSSLLPSKERLYLVWSRLSSVCVYCSSESRGSACAWRVRLSTVARRSSSSMSSWPRLVLSWFLSSEHIWRYFCKASPAAPATSSVAS
uniref:Uncharacterized protein n=1 Tax=Ixodes ricinus TaxID=34613 RepID=A0A6B0UK86_IXORI